MHSLVPGSREDDRTVRKDAEAQQTILSGIRIQMAVVNLGPLYWNQLHIWAKSRSLLSPEDESFVSVASGMPRKLPTERQSARLLKIKERVEVEGFLPS
jgi:hypothetical protein